VKQLYSDTSARQAFCIIEELLNISMSSLNSSGAFIFSHHKMSQQNDNSFLQEESLEGSDVGIFCEFNFETDSSGELLLDFDDMAQDSSDSEETKSDTISQSESIFRFLCESKHVVSSLSSSVSNRIFYQESYVNSDTYSFDSSFAGRAQGDEIHNVLGSMPKGETNKMFLDFMK